MGVSDLNVVEIPILIHLWTREKTAVDLCGGNISSTKQSNTKILSTKSLGDVIAGAFAVLRVEFVLRDADRAV